VIKAIKNTFAGKPDSQELNEPTNNKIARDYKIQAYWIEWAALLIELFAFSLVVAWAWDSQSHWLLASICVGAFVGFQIARIYTVPLLVNAIKSKHYGMVVLGFILVFATLLVLFAATVFENVNKSDEGVNERVLNSPAMKALELEIGQTRDKLASLAAFSNPEKAHNETQELKANEAARLAKIEKTKTQISGLMNGIPKNKAGDSAGNTLSALTAGCTNGNWYDKTYCGEVRSLKAQLKSLDGSAGGEASYNARYDEYNGLQTHLTSLEKQRAELLTSQGEGVINAYRPEDTLIASLFGINPQTASFSKWLVFSAVLDLLGLGLRFLASMARFRASGVPDLHEYMRKVKAFATLYGMEQLEDILKTQTKVTYHGAPALTAPIQKPLLSQNSPEREEHNPSREAEQFNNFMPITANVETQPIMQNNFVATMQAEPAETAAPAPVTIGKAETAAPAPAMCHCLYTNNNGTEQRLVIPFKDCEKRLFPKLKVQLEKNQQHKITTTFHDVYFNRDFKLEDGNKYTPETKFLVFKSKQEESYKRTMFETGCEEIYLDVNACNGVFVAMDEKHAVELQNHTPLDLIDNCLELKQRLSWKESNLIRFAEVNISKNGQWNFQLIVKLIEDSNHTNNEDAAEHFELFLTYFKVKQEFYNQQEKARLHKKAQKQEEINQRKREMEERSARIRADIRKISAEPEELTLNLDDDVVESPVKEKQSFIGFIPPTNQLNQPVINQPVNQLVNNQLVNNQPVNNQPVNNETVIKYENYERVSSENSGKAGKGRVGKIDSCVECNDDYIVKSYHQIRCPTCSTKTRAQYAKTALKGN